MATEKLKFKISLFATSWNKSPTCEILVNDKSYFTGEIDGSNTNPQVIEFDADLEEDKQHTLTLKRGGKDNHQTIVNEKGDILKDQLLHIKSIEIDEIDIGALVFEGVYTPKYPEPWATQQAEQGNKLPETLKNVTQMGHNGTWSMSFASPFYMWLLENLY